MSTEDNREQTIVKRALQIASPEERTAYLDKACAEDQELRQRIEARLRAREHDTTPGETSNPISADVARTIRVSPGPEEEAGARIGRYKLLQVIGEGGYGTVYMAQQEEPVKRRVALKVIKLGMDTKQVIARFEAERQALALMDHPNIAKVLDAGTTDTGRPFFVMELVRGIRITDYCDQANLAPTERLELFIQVCHAVQHAHQKGIIHRDIKPSNILVTLHDGKPVPKVIDFGIAKATAGQTLTDKTLFTAFEQFIGTPAYMSPEQAEMSGLDIDTRSDIYSLGVLLYELLTGKTPFDSKELVQAGLVEMRRVIREKEPPRPSTRLSTLADQDLSTVAQHRHCEPPRLLSLVRGDLDWIVMKCLEKERTRRYDTASGLATDLERHLNDEPVTARPPGTIYRFQKMVRRNKLAFAAATAVVTALALGIMVSTWQAVQARQAERLAEANAKQAESEKQRAEQAKQAARQAQLQAETNANWALSEAQHAKEKEAEVKAALSTSDFLQAVRLIEADKCPDALAYLAHSLTNNPTNHSTLTRLATLLTYHSWAIPVAGAMKHSNQVSSAQFSPDGKRIVTASWDHTARVWDARTGQPLTVPLTHGKHVLSARFSPDGKRVVTASWDGTARVWDAQSGRALIEPMKHAQAVNSAQFSPDGRRIFTLSTNTLQLWDAQTGRTLTEPMEHVGTVSSAQFSPDGKHIVTASTNTARVWDAQGGEVLTEPMKHNGTVNSAQFSPDGRRIVTASDDGTAQVWDAQRGTALNGPMKHNWTVNSAHFSPDGKRVVTASWDGTARVWDAQSAQQMTEPMKHSWGVSSAQFSLDGSRIVTASWDDTARVWDTQSGLALTEPMKHNSGVSSAQVSPDGKRVLTVSQDQIARIWDVQNGQALTEPMRHKGWVQSARFSPDGQRIVTASWDNTARVWDAQSGQSLTKPLKHDSGVYSAQFSPDGQRIVTAANDGTARVWNVQSGEAVTEPMNHALAVYAAQFSPDGEQVVTICSDHAARVWDTQSGYLVETRVPNQDRDPAQFSADGKRILAVWANIVQVWETQSGEELTQPMKHNRTVSSAQFSPDGRRIVTTSDLGTAQVWDAQSGQPVTELMRQRGYVRSAQFSPDGTRIVTASGDNTARLWDAQSGQPVTEPMKHEAWVRSAQFSPDGTRIVTASDNTARVWDVQNGQLVTEPMKHDAYVRSAQFSPDGKSVVTISSNTVRVWNAESGQPLTESMKHNNAVKSAEFSPNGKRILSISTNTVQVYDAQSGQMLIEPIRHKWAVNSAEFSPDSARIVTASGDNTARVWDAQNGRALTEPMKHTSGVRTAHFSPDGKQVLTASWDKPALLWDAQNGHPLIWPRRSSQAPAEPMKRVWGSYSVRFGGGRPQIAIGIAGDSGGNHVEYSPDGKRMVMTSDKTVQVRDAGRVRPRTEPRPEPMKHKWTVNSAQFSLDGKRVVTASRDRTARVWDAETGQPRTESLKHNDAVTSAQFSPDGDRVVTGSQDSTARVWDTQSGEALSERLKHSDAVHSVQFSVDGRRILTVSANTLQVWDVAPARAEVPGWLLPLVEAVAGERLNKHGVLEVAEQDRAELLESIRRQLAQASTNDDWVVWGRWFLADRATRTISPFSTVTVAEYVERCAKEAVAERLSMFRGELEGRHAEAVGGDIKAINALSWLFATSPRADVRDGHVAVVLAKQAAAWTQRRDPGTLDTLAAAYAEAGQLDRAVEVEQEALDLLLDDTSKRKYELRLKLYQANSPFRASYTNESVSVAEDQEWRTAFVRVRGTLAGQYGAWTEGARDLRKAVALSPNDHWNYFQLAPLLLELETGDVKGYRRLYREMMARFGTTNASYLASQNDYAKFAPQRAAKVCLLVRGPQEEMEAARKLAETAHTSNTNQGWAPWFELTRSLAEYRAGEFTNAAEWAVKALKQAKEHQAQTGLAWQAIFNRDLQAYAVLAMAEHRLGRPDARVNLGKAVEIAERKLPEPGSGDLGPQWHDWIMSHILLREARALIEGGGVSNENP